LPFYGPEGVEVKPPAMIMKKRRSRNFRFGFRELSCSGGFIVLSVPASRVAPAASIVIVVTIVIRISIPSIPSIPVPATVIISRTITKIEGWRLNYNRWGTIWRGIIGR